jgi:hypothetical protein
MTSISQSAQLGQRLLGEIELITQIYSYSVSSSSPVAPKEHRESTKRFASLQFLNFRQLVGHVRREISPSQGRYLTQTQNKQRQTAMP